MYCLQSCKRLLQTIATWVKRLVIVKLCHWKCGVDALKELAGKKVLRNLDNERTEYFQFLTWWWEDLGKSYLKSAFSHLKTKFIEGTMQMSLIWFLIFARENTWGCGSSLFPIKHCWISKKNMATVWRFRAGFFFYHFPFSCVLKDGLRSQTPQSKNSNFQALLEVCYCQEMSLFMDDLLTSNLSPELTSWRVAPQVDDHLLWITPCFETNKR